MFDTQNGYGIVSRALHWSMALAIVAMFGVGLWMTGLDYYSPYYQTVPALHKSVGIVLIILLAARWVWRLVNVKPHQASLTKTEKTASHFVHVILYPLLLVLMVSGYFISTADGRPISVFGLFEVPALITQKGLEVIAGQVHYYIAFLIIAIASFHAAAALFHHFVRKDNVLRSMIIGGKNGFEPTKSEGELS